MRATTLLAACFVLALGACGDDAPAARGPAAGVKTPGALRDVVVHRAQDGGSTGLRPGQGLVVELPATPETGFAWRLVAVDEAVLRAPAMEEYEPPGPAGGAGLSVWRFRAAGPGTTTLRLEYARVGEDAPGRVTTFTFTVVVD